MNSINYLEWAPMIAALAAVFTLAWQIHRETKSNQQKELEVKRAAKMKIISDLVSLRFVLTPQSGVPNLQNAQLEFNSTLSRIPIDFIDHNEVLERYHELGNSFTSEKYYDLIKKMLESAGHPVPEYFTVDLLDTVPSKSNNR